MALARESCLALPEDAKKRPTKLSELQLNKLYYYTVDNVIASLYGPKCFSEITEVIPLSIDCKTYDLSRFGSDISTTNCTIVHKNIKTDKEEKVYKDGHAKNYYEVDEKIRKNIYNRQTVIAAALDPLPFNMKQYELLPFLKRSGGTRRRRSKRQSTRRRAKRTIKRVNH